MRRALGAMTMGAAILAGTAGPALAKGEVNHVTIQGPGLSQPWVVDDASLARHLGMAALEALDAAASPPGWIDEAYLVTRATQSDGRVFPLDQVLYVPHPLGGKALVYYVGFYNGEGPYDRHWFYATKEGQRTMETILRQARLEDGRARLDEAGDSQASVDAAAAAEPATPSTGAGPGPTVPQLAAFGLLLMAAGFGAGRAMHLRRAPAAPSQR